MPFLDRRRVIAALLAAATNGSLVMGLMSAATPAHAQFGGIVFDPRNYAQNILTAARTLQSVNQQIQQIQNEARMLVAMGKNLSRIDFPQLDILKQKLAEIDRLMGRAQAIDPGRPARRPVPIAVSRRLLLGAPHRHPRA